MRRAGRRAALAAVVLAVLAAACGGTSKPQASKTVRVGIGPFLANSPTYLAKERGYFSQQGLDVQLVPFIRSSDAYPALSTGRIDATIGAASASLINAIAKGTGIKVVADEGQILAGAPCNRHSILASQRIFPSLKSLSDIKGHKVAFGDNTIDSYFMYKTLQSAHLALTDVTADDVEDSVLPAALGRGDLDFVFASEPTLSQLLSLGKAKDWIAVDKFTPGMQTSMMLFGPNLLNKDRETGRKLVKANLQGIAEFAKGKTDGNVATAAAFSKLDAKVLRGSCWPTYSSSGRINWNSIDDIQKFFAGRKAVDKTVTESQFWTDEFLK